MSARDHDRRSPEDPGQGRRCWRAGGRVARRRRGGRPARPFGAGLARAARRQRRAAGARARSAGASGLHFRHHGDAQGRAADPCQSVRQSRRAGGRAPRAAGRSGAPAAAPAARLSADRGPAGAARVGCGGGPAGRHHRAADQRGAAGVCLHHHDRRAAAVRGHARRHRAQDGRPREGRARQLPAPAGLLHLAAAPLRLADGAAAVLAAASPGRSLPPPARVGRRAAQARDRSAAQRAGLGGPGGLRAERDLADPDLQSEGPRAAGLGGPGGQGHRYPDRAAARCRARHRRNPGARAQRVRGLLAQRGGHQGGLHRRRLLPHRRSRPHRRRRLSVHRRPQQGDDRRRGRQEHFSRGRRGRSTARAI